MLELSQHALKRLRLIDLYLAFSGRVTRGDLIAHFDVGTATASRTFKEYRDRYPDNLTYSVNERRYLAAPMFRPAFEHDVDRALSLLAYGVDYHEIAGVRFGAHVPTNLTAPLDPFAVSAITRALVSGTGVDAAYASGSSGETYRTLFPTSLFQGGGAWYFRAFDPEKDGYRTFRFSRVSSAEPSRRDCSGDRIAPDPEWAQQVTVTVAPHPSRENQVALREDLGLSDKPVKNIMINAAVCGFVLTDLRVDCSLGGDMNALEYPLRLMNRHELTGIGSMAIAPGFRQD
ncbi:helix-turn-helix transcriptional regulator [Microbulbifer magnicolonia]|uniref:helix-turn-helix transcriptional regulator n=1 Tax=Microbulbifer magnicolonia TaxID=3109744 RepID=UPI002B400612|nr:WYL domain-containing protein [Microbulbifer sp. GG15]